MTTSSNLSPNTEPLSTGRAKLPDGRYLAYEVHGPRDVAGESGRGLAGKTPVFLIRPLGGTMALWGKFRAILAEQFRVIAFDYLGAGQSSAGPAWVSTKAFARDCLCVLDHLAIAKANVFGISLGGMTATELAILAPSRIAKLCIAAAPVRGISLSRAGIRRELALARCFLSPANRVEMKLVDRVLTHHFRARHPDDLRAIDDAVRAEPASRTALFKHALAGFLHDASAGISHITAPTLVLVGDHDSLLGVEPSRALAQKIPNATFQIIKNSGHDLTLEQPAVTANTVSQFFA